jgi:cell division protein FtsQ
MPAKALPAVPRLRWSIPVAIPRLARFVPSRRSLLIGAGVVAIAAGAYAIARETSLFAIERIDVSGGSSAVDARVARTLAPLVGRSLVGLSGAEVLQRTEALPTVVSATYDRAFPSTLRVRIVPELPVAVLRDGASAWVVSGRGRVIRPVALDKALRLPRIWIAAKAVRVGEVLPRGLGGSLARALTAAGPMRARVATASITNGVLVFHLRSGIELVLGAPNDIALKAAVAARILPRVPSGTRTIDVSVPSRVVSSLQSPSS